MRAISILTMTLLFFFTGCTENTTESKQAVAKVQTPVEKVEVQDKLIKDEKIDEMAKNIKDKTSDVIDTAAQMAKELSKESKVIADEMKVESDKVIKKIAKESKVMTAAAIEKINEVKQDFDVKMDEVIEEGALSKTQVQKAESLYLKCAGCHGQKAERSALNKSQIIQGWSSQQVLEALQGYKAGTYGAVMKSLMQGQVASLSDEDMQLLSDYIASLK